MPDLFQQFAEVNSAPATDPRESARRKANDDLWADFMRSPAARAARSPQPVQVQGQPPPVQVQPSDQMGLPPDEAAQRGFTPAQPAHYAVPDTVTSTVEGGGTRTWSPSGQGQGQGQDLAQLQRHGLANGGPPPPVQLAGSPPPVQIREPDVQAPDSLPEGAVRLRGGKFRIGATGTVYSNMDDYRDTRRNELFSQARAALGGPPVILDGSGGFSPENAAAQQQYNARLHDAFVQSVAASSQSDQQALNRQLGLGDLAVRRGGLDVESQKTAATQATERAKIASTEGISAADRAANLELGRGNLDVSRGRLSLDTELGHGKQSLEEKKADYEIGSDRSGQKAYDALVMSGRSAEEANEHLENRRRNFPDTNPRRPAEGGGGGEEGEGGAGGGGGGVPGENERFRAAFGDGVNVALREIRTGSNSKGPNEWASKTPRERMLASARLLAQKMDRPGNAGKPEVRAAMAEYLRSNYGKDFDDFINPSQTTQLFRRMGNAWSPPSEEEILSSQFRDAAGGAVKGMTVPERLGAAAYNLTPLSVAYNMASGVNRGYQGRKAGENASTYLGEALKRGLPLPLYQAGRSLFSD